VRGGGQGAGLGGDGSSAGLGSAGGSAGAGAAVVGGGALGRVEVVLLDAGLGALLVLLGLGLGAVALGAVGDAVDGVVGLLLVGGGDLFLGCQSFGPHISLGRSPPLPLPFFALVNLR
jgi:hypothetical protein